jgi:hypothetical protein
MLLCFKCLEYAYNTQPLLFLPKIENRTQLPHLRYHILVTFVLLILFCS